MKELIERQAAIETLKKLLYESAFANYYNPIISDVYAEMAENRIETWVNLIPAAHEHTQPEEGEWMPSTKYKGFLTCSVCEDCYIEGWSDKEKKWKYCPQCGARMS